MFTLALIAFSLSPAGETQVSTAPQGQTVGDEIRCRKYEEIGSLVKKRKVCRTAAQWRKVDDAARKTGRDMQERGMGGPLPSN